MRGKIAAVIVVLLVAGGYVFYLLQNDPSSRLQKTYSNDTYGFSFKYPAEYTAQETDLRGSGDQPQYAIVLLDAVSAQKIPSGSDGPPTITFEVFKNDFNNRPLENWVRNSRVSNFTQSIDGRLARTTVAGAPAFFYRWDGLYRADTYALAHRDNVIMITVTFNSLDDQIRQYFTDIVGSLRLR